MAVKQGQEDNSVEREESGDINTIEIQPEPDEREEDDDDDDGGDEGPPAAQQQRPSKRRRSEQYRQTQETAARVPELERQLQETRQAMAQMQGMFQMDMHQRQHGTNPHKELEDRVQAAYDEQNRHYEQFMARAAKMTPEERDKEARRAMELDRKKAEAQFDLVSAQRGIGRAPSAQEMEQRAFQAQLNARYPDLVNTRAGQAGMLILQQKLLQGKPFTWETLDEAADEARGQFGMQRPGKAPAPTRETRAKYEGLPRGGAPSQGQRSAAPIKITKNQDKMVAAMYPDLYAENANKARQKWWNNFGKKSQERARGVNE